jgi:hypothetical protein
MSLGYANATIAFQNHGGKGTKFPQSLFEWSAPPDTDVVPQLGGQRCGAASFSRVKSLALCDTLAGHVLISGIISFVVDNSETEFDERIDDVRQVGQRDSQSAAAQEQTADAATAANDGVLQMASVAPEKKVFVPEVFSSTNGYAANAQFNK